MEFIRSFGKEEGCFLCRMAQTEGIAPEELAQRDRSNVVLHRGERCLCVMNRFPYSNGHLLIAPYVHEADLDRLDDAVLLELMALTRTALRVLREAVSAQAFNVGLNLGVDAGAGLAEHVHLHVVPRWRGDTNFMPVIGETKVIPQALNALYDELKARWPGGRA